MGKEYLTEAATFECPFGMKFRVTEISNRKACYDGKKLLTSGALLTPVMPVCKDPKAPKNPPVPCLPITITGGVKHKATCSLLTMSDSATCPTMGQTVKPKKSGSNSHVMYNEANSAKVPAIKFPTQESQTKSKSTTSSDKKITAEDNLTSNDKKISAENNPTNNDKKINVEDKSTNNPTSKIKEISTVADDYSREGILCSCNKSECLTCAYRLDNESATVNNNSGTLRKNYNATKPHMDSYDRYFDNEVEPLGNSKPNKWSYAAHHLISGNQVFKQNAELVRLARFCGYDINSYENCIMLAGYPEDYPNTEKMKSVTAYDVMSEGRIQWHVGSHSYKFTDDEKIEICKQIAIRNKIKLTQGDIKTYAELVQAEIDKLRYRLNAKKNHQNVCYADIDAKRQFCEKLNNISQKIKAKLAAFSDVGKPHHSFPFFVSKEAYRYTYALPRTRKVITVLKEDSRLILSLFRLEHFTDTIAEKYKSLSIKPKDKIAIELSDETWQKDCILFCDNVSFFVYLEDTPRNILPFTVDNNHQFPTEIKVTGKDGQKFLEDNDTEILVWLRDNPKYGYISPALMVKNRIEEYSFGKV